MKKSAQIFILALSYASLFFISFSCESHDEVPESAFETLRDDRQIAADSAALYQKGRIDSPEVSEQEVNEFESVDGWNQFKSAIQESVKDNTRQLKTMKAIAGLSVEDYRKLTKLEKENNDLLVELNEFVDSDSVETAKFWTRMEKDMNELKTALDELNTRITAIILD